MRDGTCQRMFNALYTRGMSRRLAVKVLTVICLVAGTNSVGINPVDISQPQRRYWTKRKECSSFIGFVIKDEKNGNRIRMPALTTQLGTIEPSCLLDL